MTRIMIISLTALLLAACGARGQMPVGELLPTQAASSDSAWTLRFSYSGGIAGFNRSLEVRSNGQATVTDVRTGKTVKLRLTSAQLSRLHELAGKAVYQADGKPGVCADCFVYTIEIESGNGAPFTARLDDVSLEDSGLSDLVDFLRTTVDQSLNP